MLDRSLDSLQPEFKAKVEMLLRKIEAAGYQIKITETIRSFERSNELYAQGRTKPGKIVTRAKAGESYHNYGLAFDCYPVDDNPDSVDLEFDKGKPVINFDRYPHLLKVMEHIARMAMECGIEWGGHWTRKDLPHFQDADAPLIAECKRLWPKGWKPNG